MWWCWVTMRRQICFPIEDPLGKDVECDGDVFTVIGVLDLQPQPFGSGRNHAGQLGLSSRWRPSARFIRRLLDFWIVVKYDDRRQQGTW